MLRFAVIDVPSSLGLRPSGVERLPEALRRAARAAGRDGRFGLLFADGHVDFYQPEASPSGEVADMDLALVTGRGPAILAQLDADGGPGPQAAAAAMAIVARPELVDCMVSGLANAPP